MSGRVRASGNSGLGLRSPHAGIGVLCLGLIAIGVVFTDELELSPADGLGYWLGIFGLTSMTLLLGYSFRKRFKWLRNVGPMRTWFEIHLVLGLIGPTAILYHTGFALGSMNSTVSLACVLAVSGSGIGGRFLYGRMHRSLAGPRRTVMSFYRAAAVALKPLEEALEQAPRAHAQLQAFSEFAQADRIFFLRPFKVVAIRPRAWWTKRQVIRVIRSSVRPARISEATRDAVSNHFRDICKAVELSFFEQLFALWHAIHVPLTVILFASAAIHIVAVHLY